MVSAADPPPPVPGTDGGAGPGEFAVKPAEPGTGTGSGGTPPAAPFQPNERSERRQDGERIADDGNQAVRRADGAIPQFNHARDSVLDNRSSTADPNVRQGLTDSMTRSGIGNFFLNLMCELGWASCKVTEEQQRKLAEKVNRNSDQKAKSVPQQQGEVAAAPGKEMQTDSNQISPKIEDNTFKKDLADLKHLGKSLYETQHGSQEQLPSLLMGSDEYKTKVYVSDYDRKRIEEENERWEKSQREKDKAELGKQKGYSVSPSIQEHEPGTTAANLSPADKAKLTELAKLIKPTQEQPKAQETTDPKREVVQQGSSGSEIEANGIIAQIQKILDKLSAFLVRNQPQRKPTTVAFASEKPSARGQEKENASTTSDAGFEWVAVILLLGAFFWLVRRWQAKKHRQIEALQKDVGKLKKNVSAVQAEVEKLRVDILRDPREDGSRPGIHERPTREAFNRRYYILKIPGLNIYVLVNKQGKEEWVEGIMKAGTVANGYVLGLGGPNELFELGNSHQWNRTDKKKEVYVVDTKTPPYRGKNPRELMGDPQAA
ncbi:MAG: hypothetical protein HY537_11905 [Deltaproteobacteria bacterium]|nr:hypothetical protein [Deltaproteobacteria bacterium]